jgi:hypothetical protein
VDEVWRRENVFVVGHVVVADFGTYEHVPPDVVAKTSAHINEEVIGTGIARAKENAVVRRGVTIEAGTLPPNSAEKIKASFLVDPGLVDSIEVKEQGAIRDS